MARLSKFDQGIKDKVKNLKAEPSAKVWAGIRQAVPAQASAWSSIYTKLGLGILLIGLLAGSWWAFSPESATDAPTKSEQLAGNNPERDSRQPLALAAAVPEAINAEDELAQPGTLVHNQASKLDQGHGPTQTRRVAAPFETPAPARTVQNVQMKTPVASLEDKIEDTFLGPQGEIENKNHKENLEQAIEIAPQETITLQEEIAAEDNKSTVPVKTVEEEQAEAATSRKRKYSLTNLRNMDGQEIKAASNKLLNSLAREVGDQLGIKTKVDTDEVTAQTKKTTTAKLGPFRVKRVRKVKN